MLIKTPSLLHYHQLNSPLGVTAHYKGGGVLLKDQTTHRGRWTASEASFHINYLELKAIQMGLRSFCSNLHNTHIKILSDNQTAVADMRNMGGTHSSLCN